MAARAGSGTARGRRAGDRHVELMPLFIIGGLALFALAMTMWRGSAAELTPSLRIVAPGGQGAVGTPEAPPPTSLVVPPLPRGVVGDSWRREEGTARLRRPDGSRLRLTLDVRAQAGVEKLLRRRRVAYSAVVIIDARTGAVRVYAEHREKGEPAGAGHHLTTARAPAASVFKIVTTAALLEAGVDPETRTCFHGGVHGITSWHLKDRPKFDKRCQTLTEALAHSSNVVFARRALRHLERGVLAVKARELLFGRTIPFDVKTRPSRFSEGRSDLRRARAAAGFVGATLSPLHAAVIGAALANGGIAMRPFLVQADSLQPEFERVPEELGRVVPAEHAATLVRMLATTTIDGTARRAFRRWPRDLQHIGIAGKTGSLTGKGGKTYRHYTWFVGAAPAADPEIGFAVLAVNGNRARAKAADLGRDALAIYFDDRRFKPEGPGL